jgi:Ca2+/Na+ antiporter
MKIIKRNYEVRNQIFFLILSLVYLQAIYSLSRGESIFTVDALKSFFLNHYLILAVTVLTIFMISTLKKQSDKLLLFCLILITSKNFIMLAASFNKLILGLNFIYLIFAFYFFVTWELEMAKASYNPLFSHRDLEKESRFHLAGKMENMSTGAIIKVLITNIDEDGCFVLLASEDIEAVKSKGHFKLTAEYEGVEFIHEATMLSSYDRGVGLEFIKNEKPVKNQLDWSELYKVCLERGLFN